MKWSWPESHTMFILVTYFILDTYKIHFTASHSDTKYFPNNNTHVIFLSWCSAFLSCFEVYLDYVLVFSCFRGLLLFLNTLVSVFYVETVLFSFTILTPQVSMCTSVYSFGSWVDGLIMFSVWFYCESIFFVCVSFFPHVALNFLHNCILQLLVLVCEVWLLLLQSAICG